MDLPLLHFKQFLQKKSAISYLQTCNINLVFLSLIYSSTTKGKTGKSYTSVVHGLHTSQLLLCPTEIWFVHKCRQFYCVNFSKQRCWFKKKMNQCDVPVTFLALCFLLVVTSFFHSFPVFLNVSFLSRQYSRVMRAVSCSRECNFFDSQNKLHYKLHQKTF